MYPIARHLSETIGPRPAGTPAERTAALYLAGLFGRMGLHVEMQSFRFLNWMPLGGPILEVLEPYEIKIPVAPMAFTLPTDSAGVEGDVVWIGETLLQLGNIRRRKYVLDIVDTR